ncbi:FecR domain-containing protein [Breoghania sp.]|uniref:FecR domain-containing protein n=1 Tax=Breoghania sp. TaxID=2065378 RepID=UPI0026021DD7|nr:FecR domain-containing protein [Breoghania sp.]MDJ0930596.1 FecR domain-containing protein [Breoghania sp.]
MGEQKTVALPDGSTALLDGASALSVDFSSTARHLELAEGAKIFEVAPDPARPFVVSAGYGESVAAESSFAVKLGAFRIVVDCVAGKL